MNDLDRAMDEAIKKDDAADAKLDGARWAGGPRICKRENLPSFTSEAAAQCEYCHLWHFKTKPRPPSGASSGSGRQS